MLQTSPAPRIVQMTLIFVPLLQDFLRFTIFVPAVPASRATRCKDGDVRSATQTLYKPSYQRRESIR